MTSQLLDRVISCWAALSDTSVTFCDDDGVGLSFILVYSLSFGQQLREFGGGGLCLIPFEFNILIYRRTVFVRLRSRLGLN